MPSPQFHEKLVAPDEVFAVMVATFPLAVAVKAAVGEEPAVTVTLLETDPFWSVAVTVNVPAAVALIAAVVAPVDHEYVTLPVSY